MSEPIYRTAPCARCGRTLEHTEILWTAPDHECIAYVITGNCEAGTEQVEDIGRRFADHFDWDTGRAVRAEIARRRRAEDFSRPLGYADMGKIAMRDWYVRARILTLDPVEAQHPDKRMSLIPADTELAVWQYGRRGDLVDMSWFTTRDAATRTQIWFTTEIRVVEVTSAIAPVFPADTPAPRPSHAA